MYSSSIILTSCMGRVVIIAPHPDDEIFVIRKLNWLRTENDSVSVLFLSGSQKRLDEGRRSCNHLSFEFLSLRDITGVSLDDGMFHHRFSDLKQAIQKTCLGADVILTPALEGGHQDHDSTAFACLLLLEILNANGGRVYFYPCYTSWRRTILYKVNSTSTFSEGLMKEYSLIGTTEANFNERHLAFSIYRSQAKTWLLLYPLMFIRKFFTKRDVIYVAKGAIGDRSVEILDSLKQRPLYDLHGRLSMKIWKDHIKHELS